MQTGPKKIIHFVSSVKICVSGSGAMMISTKLKIFLVLDMVQNIKRENALILKSLTQPWTSK